MELGLDKAKLLHYKALALKHLGDRAKLRLLVVSFLVLLILAAVYIPLSGEISSHRALAARQKQRYQSIRDVEALQREAASYRGRIAKDADTNDWVQYVLSGLREVRLKLRDMTSRPPQSVGPYGTVVLSIEVEGTYTQVRQFVEWMEKSDRLVRVDSIQFMKQPESLVVRMVLLGLACKHARPT
ncbi:MAG TPA: type 4a pilus biogenesis protein PilO [Phycisphaerae bacterium]|nr:type 4a pilus biogenesis protein PilO [Phycisphaerae bacterium]